MAKVNRMVGDVSVVSDEEAGQLAPDETLPEAGYSREEELLRRQDELEEKLAQLTDAKNGGVESASFSADKIKKENEILQFLDQGSFPVEHADDAYVYSWVQRDQFGKFGGVHVFRKKVRKWEMCSYGNPETAGVKSPEGYCVIGDVVLMRCRKDIYLLQRQHDDKVTNLRRYGADSELRQLGDKAEAVGIVTRVEGDLSPKQVDRMAKKAEAQRKSRAMADQWIKEGRMPGVPGPGNV